jgi:hypothetical protein
MTEVQVLSRDGENQQDFHPTETEMELVRDGLLVTKHNGFIRAMAREWLELKTQLKIVLDREAATQIRHDEKVDALEAQIAEYEKPVSDEEFRRYYEGSVGVREIGFTRSQIDHLIASRKMQPEGGSRLQAEVQRLRDALEDAQAMLLKAKDVPYNWPGWVKIADALNPSDKQDAAKERK